MTIRAGLIIASLFPAAAALADMPAEDWKPALAATFSAEAIEHCLSTAQDQRACIGQQAAACANATTEVPGDYVESLCAEIERDWWDARLNAKYGEMMALNEHFDQQYGKTGGAPDDTLVGTYRAAQRAWIGFRDASCQYESLSTGADGGPAADGLRLNCLLTMTAERTLEMERVLAYQ